MGVVWASLFHVVPMALNARAWQLLLGGGRGRSLPYITWLIWLRQAINGLLPVARVGGEVANARLLLKRGIGSARVVSSLVVSMTITLGTHAVFTACGLTLLLCRNASSTLARAVWLALGAGVLLLTMVAGVQRAGLFGLLRRVARVVGGERLAEEVGSAERLDRVMRAVWRRPSRVLECAAWQLAGWVAGSGQIWIFLHCAGSPISPRAALMVEALVQTLNSAAFLVPAGVGIQEGAFLVMGNVVGLSPSMGLALALARRARDVLLFVPALMAWQGLEGRSILSFSQRNRRETPAASSRLGRTS